MHMQSWYSFKRGVTATMNFNFVLVKVYEVHVRVGSCTSDLQLKVNNILKVNCRGKNGLVCQLLAKPALLIYNSLLVYNSLSAAIHLYMNRA